MLRMAFHSVARDVLKSSLLQTALIKDMYHQLVLNSSML
jgi:hypothetical protein